jgi:hypothetical protein
LALSTVLLSKVPGFSSGLQGAGAGISLVKAAGSEKMGLTGRLFGFPGLSIE